MFEFDNIAGDSYALQLNKRHPLFEAINKMLDVELLGIVCPNHNIEFQVRVGSFKLRNEPRELCAFVARAGDGEIVLTRLIIFLVVFQSNLILILSADHLRVVLGHKPCDFLSLLSDGIDVVVNLVFLAHDSVFPFFSLVHLHCRCGRHAGLDLSLWS